MTNKPKLVILTGPTAVGKTALSIKLAKAIDGEIISADSMQVYRRMNIGTAKITPEEMQGVKHFLVDEYEPQEEFNIVAFQQRAKEAVAEISARGHIPMIVGGTGFYIQSVVYDIDFDAAGPQNEASDINPQPSVKLSASVSPPATNGAYRAKLQQMAANGEEEQLHRMLAGVDPASAEAIHKNNVKRVIRALEFFEQTGEPISKHNQEQQQKISPYDFLYFVLNDDRQILYDRIDKRVDLMVEQGLTEEVRALKAEGCNRSMVSMQGIGYKEILDYLEGDLTLEEAIDRIKRDTRHFAKRQITWFKREKQVTWIDKDAYGYEEEAILEAMLEHLKMEKIIE